MSKIIREVDFETALHDAAMLSRCVMNMMEDLDSERRGYAEFKNISMKQAEDNIRPLQEVFGWAVYQLGMLTNDINDAYPEVKAVAA